MKRFRLLTLLALLITAVTGAWAQDPTTFKVTMKEGAKDASNWTITPTAATTTGVAEEQTVTLTYNGRLNVKSVKALTTGGAWAQGKLIYEKDFSSDTEYPFYLDNAAASGASATVTDGLLVLNNPSVQATNWDVQPEIGIPTSAITQGNTYRVVMQYKTTKAGSVTFALGSRADGWPDHDWKGQTITVSNDFQTCEAYFDSFPYNISESHILLQFGELVGTITIKKVEVYELYPFDGISWTASTKTATIAEMPAGNVVVVPEYYPQAQFVWDGESYGVPAPIDALFYATIDQPLVSPGYVASIGSTEAKQGTVMFYVSTTDNLTEDQLIALIDEGKWSPEVPNAADIKEACEVYVYYYIKGNDGDTEETTFNDGDFCDLPIRVQINGAPTYTLTLDPAPVTKATVTIDDQAATPDENGKIADLKANSSVKLNANDGYIFKKVKVKKTPKE